MNTADHPQPSTSNTTTTVKPTKSVFSISTARWIQRSEMAPPSRSTSRQQQELQVPPPYTTAGGEGTRLTRHNASSISHSPEPTSSRSLRVKRPIIHDDEEEEEEDAQEYPYQRPEEDEQPEEGAYHDENGGEEQADEWKLDAQPVDAVMVTQDDEVIPTSTRPKRAIKQRVVVSDDEEDYEDEESHRPQTIATVTTRGRVTTRPVLYQEVSDDDFDDVKPATSTRGGLQRGGRKSNDFVEEDEEYNRDEEDDLGYGQPKRKSNRMSDLAQKRRKQQSNTRNGGRITRNSSRLSQSGPNGGKASKRVDRNYDSAVATSGSDSDDVEDSLDLHDEDEDSTGSQAAKKYELRARGEKKNYYVPPPNAFDPPAAPDKGKGRGRPPKKFGSFLPANMSGAAYAALYPDKSRDADSDDETPNFSTPRKAALFRSKAAAAAAGFGGSGALAGGANNDLAGTPNNLGKLGGAANLADIDPLGIESKVSFDSVGGLGSHIQQLKEMVSLPLLYPEVFERFNITPPRGVLFHGPPGTGKTLLARALAASCSTEGRKISFFMRKGADCLSKWVGEAERQLRLLFEEAKACQPSIIFFDEIDGLAPVRSSKQDQIHASIVSTLLALMDGMDGRGQVIVIGATNRPDAIDPALRRPGRFDREFYFPLPNLEGRRKILDIHTSGWAPPIEESFKDELAALTKGYGGADLRALCTEAALNAVQRTYPQIYKTNERLMIKPETISVTARDFIVSQKNLIPSTSRATSSSAAPIPTQLVPLLSASFEEAKLALARVLPDVKKPNVLEEAEWEDDGGGFEKEKMMQAFETLRVFRPRMLICGENGMGQSYVGAAILHHLEGFHVQSLDLATLVADSGRSMEAACVQLFVEAKRHKPSILFIPSLLTWCQTVNDTVRSTIKGLLEGLEPSDPILLLAVVDGPLTELPSDVRGWFGFGKGNRVVMTSPGRDQREAFFAEVMNGIQRPPNQFPDAMPRRKRILAELAIAPPPPPRVLSPAEIRSLEEQDQKLIEILKWRLGPILHELKKRYKKFTRSLWDEWRVDDMKLRAAQLTDNQLVTGLGPENPYQNVDLDTMHHDLYKGFYHSPEFFLEEITWIEQNAEIAGEDESILKAGQMTNHAKIMIDAGFEPQFRIDCSRMAERMVAREKVIPKPPVKGKEKEVVPELVTRSSRSDGNELGIAEDIGMIERQLKRDRREEDAEVEGEDGAGPSKRARGVDGEMVNGEYDVNLYPGTTNGFEDRLSPVASTSTTAFDVTTAASNGHLFSSSLLHHAAPAHAPVASTSALPITSAVASTSTHEIAAGLKTPVRSISPAGVVTPVRPISPIIVDPPTPEPLPDFILSQLDLDRLSTVLIDATSELNVDQLEQLRAGCYDGIWRARKMWDRSELIRELEQLAKEFVEEVREMNALALVE